MKRLGPRALATSMRGPAAPEDEPFDIFRFLYDSEDIVFIRRFGDAPDIDGIYVRDGRRNIGFIYVNRAKPLTRQYFTAAHELGHHMLGHADEFDANVFAETAGDDEREANQFAADLLIPRAGLARFVSREGLDVTRLPDAIRVAMHFRVSLQPVLIQLRAIDRLSGADHSRLLVEFQSLSPNPLALWEVVNAGDKTELSPRFIEHVKEKYRRGEMTADAVSEAIDAPVETVLQRFGTPDAVLAQTDLSDLL